MLDLKVTIPNQGSKNATVHVKGIVDEEFKMIPLVKAADLSSTPKKVRIDNLLFAIQEKMGLQLWWDEGNLILPLESRGSFRFDTGLNCPEGWDGVIYASSFGVSTNKEYSFPKHFFILFDLEKQ